MAVGYSIPSAKPTYALELFGKCLFGKCKEEATVNNDLIDPKTYRITFHVIGSDDLESEVKAKSELWRGKNTAVAGAAGLVSRAKGDYRRILATLYNGGYYAGSISIAVNGKQATDFSLGEDLPDNSIVEVSVDPGPEYRFSTARIVNAAPPTFDRHDEVPSPADVGFLEGEIAKATAIRSAAINARQAWRQQGHAKAKISARDANALHDNRQLSASITIEPGPKSYFGEVTVSGTETMDSDFVAYMTGLHAGVEYDPDEIKKARKRLERLGIFASQKIDESANLTKDGQLPLKVIVNERKLRRIGVGATISTLDGAGVEAYWLHRNLFGKAERLRLDAKIGGVGESFSPDEFDYRLGATLTQPGILTPDTDLIWNTVANREVNDTFRETAAEGSATLVNFWSDEIKFSIGAAAKYGEYQDVFGTRKFFTTGLLGEFTFDNRDSTVDPTKGFFAKLNVNPFYEHQFGSAAVRFEAEGRTYYSIDDDGRSIVAARAKIGSLVGQSLATTPPDLLFFAGGGSSVRGYEFKNLGVTTPLGISGGRSFAEGSLELRQKITDTIGVVGFVDAGLVSSRQFVDFSDDFRVGIGAGFRYYTGFGPIRVDFAIPLDRQTGDPSFAFYAGIGQAF